MSSFVPVLNEHKDLVQDMAFNYYGNRIATCSCDHTVKVFDKDANGEWFCSNSWKVHCGPVWRVDWANPTYGQILATCSFDRAVIIWQEISNKSDDARHTSDTSWIKRASLVDSRCDVIDVKFSPARMGLVLAAAARDGIIRIYEATNLANLAHWNLQHEITATLASASCIAWAQSEFHRPIIAVGTDDANCSTGRLAIYTYTDDYKKWNAAECIDSQDTVNDLKFAPSMGRSFHFLAVAGSKLEIYRVVSNAETSQEAESDDGPKVSVILDADFSAGQSQFWRVSWNATGTMLSAISGDGVVHIYTHELRSWLLHTTICPEVAKL